MIIITHTPLVLQAPPILYIPDYNPLPLPPPPPPPHLKLTKDTNIQVIQLVTNHGIDV